MAPRGFIDVEGWLLKETDKAILIDVDEDKDGGGEFWLPKAEIDYRETGDGMVTVMVPEWLAIKKGMV
jgi:hypothetical protein